METAMRNVSIKDRTTPSVSPVITTDPSRLQPQVDQLLQDQPIDFSTKIRARDHAENQEDASIRKVSNDSAIDCSNDTHEEESRPAVCEPVEDQSQSYPSQSRFIPGSMPMPNISSFLPQTSTAGVGMFYPTPPVFPNFLPPSFAAGPMWPNPMAAMLQQQQEVARKIMSANGGKAMGPATLPNLPAAAIKPSFGNKQFGKQDASAIAPGSRPFPSLPGFPNPASLNNIPDPNILAEALKSHEEMFSAYKQQVLSQKAVDDAKKGMRRPAPSTFTNGNMSSVPSTQSNGSSLSESCTLSQINEDQPITNVESSNARPSDSSNGIDVSKEGPSSLSDDEKASGSGGSVGELNNGSSGSASAAAASRGPSLHSSDESLQTNDSRTSYTAAHSSGSEQNDMTGMRPRSMTLPTQSDHRLLSHSPSPSVVSTGNNSSGPGTPNSKNERSFRKRARTLPDDQKDEAYWERRRKNNEAAKRSRDSRRAKEDEIAIRAAFLEQENIRLRLELAALKTQTAKLRSELVIFQGPEDSAATDGS